MLIDNVNVSDFLTNGRIGTVTAFDFTQNGKIHAMLVKFDDENVGKEQRAKYQKLASSHRGSVPIFRETFTYNLGGSGKHLARATLIQLPLRLAWGITCHGVQGQTFSSDTRIVIHWSKGLPAKMVYVMLSRSKRLQDIVTSNSMSLRCQSDM